MNLIFLIQPNQIPYEMMKSAKQLGFCDEQIAQSIERYNIISNLSVYYDLISNLSVICIL